jgi:hypothetical protein
LIDPSVPRFPAQPISWSEVARICRRICLLRECHQPDAAEELRRGALAEAIAAIRTTSAPEAALEQKLEATFAAESERVANAAVLAELLAPLMAQQPQPEQERGRPARIPEPAGETPVVPVPVPPPARRDPADIAHFIDEMIAQEQPAPRRGSTRRAS